LDLFSEIDSKIAANPIRENIEKQLAYFSAESEELHQLLLQVYSPIL
jgi:hypothetical protein